MHRRRRPVCIIGLVVLFLSARGEAQTFPGTDAGDLVHYAYGNLFGTGYYQLDDRSVALIRMPFRYQLRDPTPEKFGIRLELPTTIGIQNYDFKSIPELDLNSLATVSVLPGVSFNFLLSDR